MENSHTSINNLFVGIDPGEKGSIAIFTPDGRPFNFIRTNTTKAKVQRIRKQKASGKMKLTSKIDELTLPERIDQVQRISRDLWTAFKAYIKYYGFNGADLKVHFLIEHVSTRPGQGISSTGKLLRNSGYLIGIVSSIAAVNPDKVKIFYSTPQFWQKQMGKLRKPYDYEDNKDILIEHAQQVFPWFNNRFTTKKDKETFADSALMAQVLINHYDKFTTNEAEVRKNREVLDQYSQHQTTP